MKAGADVGQFRPGPPPDRPVGLEDASASLELKCEAGICSNRRPERNERALSLFTFNLRDRRDLQSDRAFINDC